MHIIFPKMMIVINDPTQYWINILGNLLQRTSAFVKIHLSEFLQNTGFRLLTNTKTRNGFYHPYSLDFIRTRFDGETEKMKSFWILLYWKSPHINDFTFVLMQLKFMRFCICSNMKSIAYQSCNAPRYYLHSVQMVLCYVAFPSICQTQREEINLPVMA